MGKQEFHGGKGTESVCHFCCNPATSDGNFCNRRLLDKTADAKSADNVFVFSDGSGEWYNNAGSSNPGHAILRHSRQINYCTIIEARLNVRIVPHALATPEWTPDVASSPPKISIRIKVVLIFKPSLDQEVIYLRKCSASGTSNFRFHFTLLTVVSVLLATKCGPVIPQLDP